MGQLKGQEVGIILKDDDPIFKKLYKLSEVERTLVQTQILELLHDGLVELSKGEYA
jgi:hypothetical protein